MRALAALAFAIAAVLFLLEATSAAALGTHKLAWGLCAVAVGLLLEALPWPPVVVRQ